MCHLGAAAGQLRGAAQALGWHCLASLLVPPAVYPRLWLQARTAQPPSRHGLAGPHRLSLTPLCAQARKGEADRHIPTLRPKHLLVGHRGKGKTDRR